MLFKKKKISKIEAPEGIEVINYTEFKNVDAIVKALSYHIFGFERMRIRVFYLPKIFKSEQTDFWGIAQKAADGPQSYSIFVNKRVGAYQFKKILSHEFVHIDQFEKGELTTHGDGYVWKGEFGSMREVEYNRRPFELDAQKRQKVVLRDLNRVLYK